MLTDTELIRKLDFFESLAPKTIQQIAQLCIVREFAVEDYIVRQGESGLGLYFITRGRVKVEIERDGMKAVVAELKEGDFLGELAIIDDKARSANVICLEETRCLLLTRDSFSKLLKKHPEIALQMLRSLVGRIRSTNDRVSGSRAAQAAAASAAPAPTPPGPPPPASSTPLDGIGAATERITAVLPRPEDMVKMYSSTKDRVQSMLVGVFGTMYVVKAMTRFSMAMVGCPVTVRPENRDPEVLETIIAGVKVVLFPARSRQRIRIEAYADGDLSATVFRPIRRGGQREVETVRWEGSVRRNEVLELHVPVATATGSSPAGATPAPCRLVGLPAARRGETGMANRWAITRARWRNGVPIARSNSGRRAGTAS